MALHLSKSGLEEESQLFRLLREFIRRLVELFASIKHCAEWKQEALNLFYEQCGLFLLVDELSSTAKNRTLVQSPYHAL